MWLYSIDRLSFCEKCSMRKQALYDILKLNFGSNMVKRMLAKDVLNSVLP